MSDKIFEKVTFDDSFEIDNDFIKVAMGYAILHAVGDIGSYWRTEEAEKIISDSTFAFIWKDFPDTRGDLLELAQGICHNDSRVKSLTKEYCKRFVSDVYDLIEDNEDIEDNRLRVKLACIVATDFDYLTQMCKFSLDEEKQDLYHIWRQAGLSSSKDSEFYDYLWSKVKREKGSVDIKLNILRHGFENGAISDGLLRKIAKSSPKNVKRTVTEKVAREINNLRYTLNRHKRNNEYEAAAFIQKEVDALESKIMLFVDCTDRKVVSNLLDCLSKDNLPWLMPSASQHYYLSNRLQQMIDKE